MQLDRTNADEVQKYNEQMEDYLALYEPSFKAKKKEHYTDKAKILEEFKKDFAIKFAPKGRLKNFERVQAAHGRNDRLQGPN